MKCTFAETVSQSLHVLLVIFSYTAGTRVSTVAAYSDFTSKSPDYVLSNAGLFSTKLSQANYHYLNSAILHKAAILL